MKYFQALGLVVMLACTSYAINNGRPMRLDEGDAPTFSKTILSGAVNSAVVISTFSSTKTHLTCHNTGSTQVFVGGYVNIAVASTGTYQIDPSTAGAASVWDTRTQGQIWAIANPGGSTIYCEEDR